MKKFLSVALALIIALSAFSISVFAFEPADIMVNLFTNEQSVETDTDAPVEPGLPEFEGTRTGAWASDMISLDEVRFETTSSVGFTSVVCIKGDSASIEMNADGMHIKYIINNGKQYIYFVNFPFFYLDPEDGGMTIEEFKNSVKAFDVDTLVTFVGAKEENGYYIEEFISSTELKYYFYFKGEKLEKYIIIDNEYHSESVTCFSDEVKDKDVRKPFFAINLTPLIDFFMSLFI